VKTAYRRNIGGGGEGGVAAKMLGGLA